MSDNRLTTAMATAAADVEAELDRLAPIPDELECRVWGAMRYSLFAGGKRLRPFLVLESASLFGVPRAQALRAAAAIEMVHTYSLIHDDLPCMDDDDLRRGKPPLGSTLVERWRSPGMYRNERVCCFPPCTR